MGTEDFVPGGVICQLWDEGAPAFDESYGQPQPTLSFFRSPESGARGAVIVCPGGSYARKSAHEGVPVAQWLNTHGISAFVVDYRVAPYRHPAPLTDMQRAVRYVRYHAARFGIDEHRIAVLGFSAGGHAAASVGTHFDGGVGDSPDPIERASSRPDALILCYPVISFVKSCHQGSKRNLLGENASHGLCQLMSAELQVTQYTPPTFLWHTADDSSVPVQNSLVFADALSRCTVPFALHISPHGPHGVGLACDNPELGRWKGWCIEWLRANGW